MNSEDKINLVSLDELKDETFDACIIGTGAGGAVVGYHLANSGRKVLMLEKGGYYSQKFFADKKNTKEVEKIEKVPCEKCDGLGYIENRYIVDEDVSETD